MHKIKYKLFKELSRKQYLDGKELRELLLIDFLDESDLRKFLYELQKQDLITINRLYKKESTKNNLKKKLEDNQIRQLYDVSFTDIGRDKLAEYEKELQKERRIVKNDKVARILSILSLIISFIAFVLSLVLSILTNC